MSASYFLKTSRLKTIFRLWAAKSRELGFWECGIRQTEPPCRLNDFAKRFGHWIGARRQTLGSLVALPELRCFQLTLLDGQRPGKSGENRSLRRLGRDSGESGPPTCAVFPGVNEDTLAFNPPRVHGNKSGTRKRGPQSLKGSLHIARIRFSGVGLRVSPGLRYFRTGKTDRTLHSSSASSEPEYRCSRCTNIVHLDPLSGQLPPTGRFSSRAHFDLAFAPTGPAAKNSQGPHSDNPCLSSAIPLR
jgi:hypothetical protein